MDLAIFLVCFFALVVDMGILWYVRQEYIESRELNMRLGKIYRAKKKKINADKIVKAVLAQETPAPPQ